MSEILPTKGPASARASGRIPTLALPYVSERAKKTLDQVSHIAPLIFALEADWQLSGRGLCRTRMYTSRHRLLRPIG